MLINVTIYIQLENVSTEEELKHLINEKFSFRFDCGVCQSTSSVTLSDEHIISSIALHFCIYACKVELDEIRRGLLSLGFMGLMCQNPSLKSLFKFNPEFNKLTVEILENLFVLVFSPEGSNSRAREQQTIMHFLELLQDIEGKVYTSAPY